jgi:hypothetical protein
LILLRRQLSKDSFHTVNLSSQFSFNLVHDACKTCCVMDSQVCEDFAVNGDAGFADAVGKLAVGHAEATHCGVDTRNPQLAEHTLFSAAIAVGVLACLHHCFFSDAEDVTAATAETFSEFQNFFVTGTGRNTTFNARHIISPCLLNDLTHAHAGQHLLHVTHVGLVNSCWAAQMAFVFGGFLGQDVTLKRLTALNRATWANAESLLRAALGLHFGHDCSEISVLTSFEACFSLPDL